MNFVRTRSREKFFFQDPSRYPFNIEEIAYALSNLCRFTGHVNRFYSVAQHSVLVSEMLPRSLALEGLMHDASESVLGDVSSPLKELLPPYKEIERETEKAISKAFGLPYPLTPAVKEVDRVLLTLEERDLMREETFVEKWFSPVIRRLNLKGSLVNKIYPLPPKKAEKLFLDRYYSLTGIKE